MRFPRLPAALPALALAVAIATPDALAGDPQAAGATGANLTKHWIYFTDKGEGPATPVLSERALRRRARLLPPAALVQPEDAPVHPPYLSILESLGVRVVVRSNWMNAVSAVIPPASYGAVSSLPFVERIEPVRSVRAGRTADIPPRDVSESQGAPAAEAPAPARGFRAATAPGAAPDPRTITAGAPPSLPDYGPSFAQLDAVRVPSVHALGIDGRDVVVGLLDSGFRWKAHGSLSGMRVLGERDFVAGDGDTADGPGDPPGQDLHGTLVLSVLGGYAPGNLVGPAFGSSYLLAKTEYVPTETQAEEDFWAAGIEWLEANGADVVNSSVGYDAWDDGSGYSWWGGDFDGRTSIVAKAALRAARLGVLLVACMGNEGNGDGVEGTLLTPADVDTAVSVGAATFDGLLSTSSSTGPASDGRVKPDLIAPGSGVYCASTSGPDAYQYQSGTSVAAPLAAGAAALVLSARPGLAPVEVRDILRAAADTARVQNHAVFPNDSTGWGYLDALRAVLSSGPVFSNRPWVAYESDGAVVSTAAASGAGVDPSSVVLWYRDEESPSAIPETLAMSYDTPITGPPGSGGFFSAKIPPRPPGTVVALGIIATDSAGRSYSSPAPALYDRWLLEYGGDVAPPAGLPGAARLLQNYPNPFNSETHVVFDLPAGGRVTLRLFDVLGRLVAEPFDGDLRAGAADARPPIVVDGAGLPSGLYVCRLTTPSGTLTGKMLLVR